MRASSRVAKFLRRYISFLNVPKKDPAAASTLAASGGYYISCAAETIYANRNTLTGSIGVIASQSVDMTELLKKLGVKVETITAGKNKNMLNINSPLTDEQRTH